MTSRFDDDSLIAELSTLDALEISVKTLRPADGGEAPVPVAPYSASGNVVAVDFRSRRYGR